MSTLKHSQDALVGALTNLKSQMHTQNKSTAAGHTAGPWRLLDNGDGHWRINGWCEVDGFNGMHDCRLADVHSIGANARLIAAAPELLEALVELLEHEGQRVVNGIGLEEDSDELRAVKAQARAAIARAKGVQS